MTGHCNHCGEQVCTDATPSLREAAQEFLDVAQQARNYIDIINTQAAEELSFSLTTAMIRLSAALAQQDEQEPVAWLDEVKRRLLTWRQSFVNRHGDQLALDDFMDTRSLDDLIDFVCDRATLAQQNENNESVYAQSRANSLDQTCKGDLQVVAQQNEQSSNPLSSNPALSSEPVASGLAQSGSIKPASNPREWQGLMDEEIDDIWNDYCDEMGEASVNDSTDIARAIEAKLKEKNS